jgi:hypothetical protein
MKKYYEIKEIIFKIRWIDKKIWNLNKKIKTNKTVAFAYKSKWNSDKELYHNNIVNDIYKNQIPELIEKKELYDKSFKKTLWFSYNDFINDKKNKSNIIETLNTDWEKTLFIYDTVDEINNISKIYNCNNNKLLFTLHGDYDSTKSYLDDIYEKLKNMGYLKNENDNIYLIKSEVF